MKILVIGATGPTGRELVSQGIAQGHTITAGARNLESAGFPSAAKLAKVDVKDAESLKSAMAGQDAVISSLGSKISRKPTTLFSDGTRKMLQAMQAVGVRRLICITGIGAGDSRGHGGFIYDKIFQPLLLNEIYKDKDRQEELIRASDSNWTIVRPGALTNGPKNGNFRVLTDLNGITVGKISRADVAAFILSHLDDEKSFRATFTLG